MNRSKRLLQLMVWALLVLVITTFPLPDLAGAGPAGKDKAAHFLLFGGQALLVLRYLAIFPKFRERARCLIAIGASSAYAMIIEVLQAYIPGRSGSFWDFAAGAAGAIAMIVIYYLSSPRIRPGRRGSRI